MLEWIRSLFTNWDAKTTIAVLALVQPWVYWAIQKFAKRGRIDVHHTANIEVGMSGWGATIGLLGTLRAVDKDLFVSSMSVEVVREDDQSRHTLEWVAFRPPAVLLGESEEPTEVASGFVLQPSAARRYNIFFADLTSQTRIRELTEPLVEAWFNALQTNGIVPENAEDYYNTTFSQTPAHVNAFADLDPINYWHAGNYRLTLKIKTTRPNQEFTETWRFALSARDVARLRFNRLPTIRASLGLSTRPFNFVYATYQ